MSGLLIPRTHELSICCKCQTRGYAPVNDGYLPCLFVCAHFFLIHLSYIVLLSKPHRSLSWAAILSLHRAISTWIPCGAAEEGKEWEDCHPETVTVSWSMFRAHMFEHIYFEHAWMKGRRDTVQEFHFVQCVMTLWSVKKEDNPQSSSSCFHFHFLAIFQALPQRGTPGATERTHGANSWPH